MRKQILLAATTFAALGGAIYLFRPANPSILLELTKKLTFQSTKSDLSWHVGAEGDLKTNEGRLLWPDQLEQILDDEKAHHEICIELFIDPQCPFSKLAPLLETLSFHQAIVVLKTANSLNEQDKLPTTLSELQR